MEKVLIHTEEKDAQEDINKHLSEGWKLRKLTYKMRDANCNRSWKMFFLFVTELEKDDPPAPKRTMVKINCHVCEECYQAGICNQVDYYTCKLLDKDVTAHWNTIPDECPKVIKYKKFEDC